MLPLPEGPTMPAQDQGKEGRGRGSREQPTAPQLLPTPTATATATASTSTFESAGPSTTSWSSNWSFLGETGMPDKDASWSADLWDASEEMNQVRVPNRFLERG